MVLVTFMAAALYGFAISVVAQTSTSCNPTNATCSPNVGLAQWYYTADFTGSDASALFNQSWTQAEGTSVSFDNNGIKFSITAEGQAPTISSNFYFFFGRIDVKMQAAPGTGIVSSIVFESDDLDEIDWEALGGNTSSIETNYFGKGNTTTYDRATYPTVTTPQDTFHTYSVEWTATSIVWLIDGAKVRTLSSADANGGSNFPQTPASIRLGNWAGGAVGENPGTISWAGGETDFTEVPFNMYIKSITVTNYNPANYYNWTDHSGDWTSIKAYNSSSANSTTQGSGSTTSTSGFTVTTSDGVVVTRAVSSNSSAPITGFASYAAFVSVIVVLMNVAAGAAVLI